MAQSDGVTPKVPFSNPFPGGVTPPFAETSPLIDVQGNGNSAATTNTPAPYVQQWNLDIQRQFQGDLLVDIAYAGSKGTHLPMHSQEIDQLQPQYLPQNAAGRDGSEQPGPQSVCRQLHRVHRPGAIWWYRDQCDDKGSPVAAALPAVR